MGLSRKPGEGQEGMIAQAGMQHTIAAEALPLEPGVAVTQRDEQAFHLIGVLQRFDALPSQAEWLRSARSPMTRLNHSLYAGSQKKGDDIIAGRQNRHDELVTEAQTEFYKAFGRNVLIDAGFDANEVDDLASKEYQLFSQRYRGGTAARFEKRSELKERLQPLLQPAAEAELTAGDSKLKAPEGPSVSPINLAAHTALARMLRPEFQRLNAAHYEGISSQTVAYYKPARLRANLLQVPGNSPNAVGYVKDGETRPTFVTVPPPAINLTRSVPKLAEAAVNGSEKKRHHANGNVVDLDAPRRAGIHAVESRQQQLIKYRTNVIGTSIELIEQFEEALNYQAGLARFGSEAKARTRFAELQTGTFDEMLWAASINSHNNTAAERMLMRRSIEKAIFMAPTAAQRRRNFASFLSLAKEWRQTQAELFDSLIATCNNYIEKHHIDD